MNHKLRTPQTIRARRQALHLTQREAADLVGVTQRQWAHYEAGTRGIPYAIARLFELETTRNRPMIKTEKALELIEQVASFKQFSTDDPCLDGVEAIDSLNWIIDAANEILADETRP